MVAPALLVASIGAADSLNPSTVGPALLLATAHKPVQALASFTAGVFLVPFVAGALVILGPGELLLDYPVKTQMLGLDIPVLRRSGKVERLTGEGWIGTINLPSLSEELYKSARWLRVFTAKRARLEPRRVLDALGRSR